jgi:hypothetical protein
MLIIFENGRGYIERYGLSGADHSVSSSGNIISSCTKLQKNHQNGRICYPWSATPVSIYTILPVRLTGSSSQNLEMLGHCYRTQQHGKSHDKRSDDTESLLRIVGYRVQDPEGSYEHSKARSHYEEGYDFVPVPVVFVDGSVRFEMGVIMVKSLLHEGNELVGHG